MLGQPVSMLIPRVVGFKLTGELPDGATATDLVLTITEMLREHGVVGKFVEFYGAGVSAVPLANRATIGNMSPEFGSTAAMFPIDEETHHLPAADRPPRRAGRAGRGLRQGRRASGTTPTASRPSPSTSSWTSPRSSRRSPARSARRTGSRSPRPRRRSARRCPPTRRTATATRTTPRTQGSTVDESVEESFPASDPASPFAHGNGEAGKPHTAVTPTGSRRASKPTRVVMEDGTETEIDHGHVVIAAITSCTNTSNPQVMIGAALLAKNAVERGLTTQAVGEDDAGPRVEGRHGLLREGRAHPVPGEARLLPGRLRLHDLHRQLRPAARAGQPGGQRGRPRRRLGALGQPQLRGPDQPRRQDELPGVAAAGHRLRARRLDGRRPEQRPARAGHRRQRRLPARHLALAAGGPAGHRPRRLRGDVQPRTTPTSSPAPSSGRTCPRRPATPSTGTRRAPTSASPRTSTACRPSRPRSRTSPAPARSPCSATR